MIKRIAVLFALTGAAHVFSILALKFMAQRGSDEQIASIGEADSLIQLIIGIIGFGMQSDAIRNIALNKNWKEKLQQAQTARVTLGTLVLGLAFLAFIKNIYLCFLMAPLLASSCDYALYARSSAVTGAWVAFARVITPLLFGIFAVYYWPGAVLQIYIGATFIVYFVTNIFISWFLKVSLIFPLSLVSLKLYLKTFPLGIINLCFYFFGLGMLLLAQLFFNEQELVASFLALKFYTIYKGAIRVIHQAFINEMKDDRICFRVDQISILLSLAFFGSATIFPASFISLFFGAQFVDHQLFFVWLSLAAIAFSVFSSSYTKLVLEKKDYSFMNIALVSVCISVACLFIATRFSKNPQSISISLLVGEIFFSFCAAAMWLTRKAMWGRVSYLLLCSLALCLPVLAKLIFTENKVTYFCSFVLMGGVLLLFSYKNFNLPARA